MLLLLASVSVVTGMGSMFRESFRWKVGVRLGWLPMTRRHRLLPYFPPGNEGKGEKPWSKKPAAVHIRPRRSSRLVHNFYILLRNTCPLLPPPTRHPPKKRNLICLVPLEQRFSIFRHALNITTKSEHSLRHLSVRPSTRRRGTTIHPPDGF